MLSATNVHKRFGSVIALNGASINVVPGEIRALLGANGSGKSTLVKVLGGLVGADSGEILIDNENKKIKSAEDSHKLSISIAYQDLSLIQRMTVLDNIFLGHELKNAIGMRNNQLMTAKAREILERLNINCELNDYIDELPPSVQSMVEIAKAISWNSDILLLDEVTASLHHDEVESLFKVLNQLKEEGKSIVMVTHRMNEVFRMCDKATILRNGEMVADVALASVNLDDIIFHMTGKRPEKNDIVPASCNALVPMLEVIDLSIEGVVDKVSMNVCKGEIIGIGGLQDQGQAEFIRSLLGAIAPSSGTIKIQGEVCNFRSVSGAIKKGIGFISGDRAKESIFSLRTIAENIYAAEITKGAIFGHISRKKVENIATEIVDKFNIKIGAISDPASSLSGGNQQKLTIGRWMLTNPDILLLDDPTKGVDISGRKEILEIIRNAANDGMTVIFSSSENDELLEVADRIYVFYEGSIKGVLEGANKTEERLVSAMMNADEGGDMLERDV